MNERVCEIARGLRTPLNSYYDQGYMARHPELRGFYCNSFSGKNKPKISYGIAIRDLTMDKWCCLVPASTIEFRILLEGNYSPAELPLMISQMYDNEIKIVKENITFETFKVICRKILLRELSELYYAIYCSHMETVRMIAGHVFEERKMQTIYADVCQLGFPKGRGGYDEPPIQSALRELKEETGIKVIMDKQENTDEWFWEKVKIVVNGIEKEGCLFKEPVVHTHLDMSGKAFKTFIWVIHVKLPKEITDNDIALENASTPNEVGSIGWHSSVYCARFSRVKELFHKVWLMSEDIKNISIME